MNTITINLPADTSLQALAQALHGIGLGIDPAAKGLTFRRRADLAAAASVCSHPYCFSEAAVTQGRQSLCVAHWRAAKEI